ncbi:MAG: hypothetical protein BWY79_02182 [Actinobacteria bacterium ADurb.Bin444]|nr:MAG: hypothetical protein BWY79_02182 [Actinobacteria bacterium ADurb.Bin444]
MAPVTTGPLVVASRRRFSCRDSSFSGIKPMAKSSVSQSISHPFSAMGRSLSSTGATVTFSTRL